MDSAPAPFTNHLQVGALEPLSSGTLLPIMRLLPDATLLIDKDGTIVFGNEQVTRLSGYSAEELIGKSLDDLIPERFRVAHAKHFHAYLRHPSARPMGVGLELFAQHKRGAELPVEISLSPISLDGRPHIICSLRDMSARKQMERARLDSERHFHAVFDHAVDGLALLDGDGVIIKINPAAIHLAQATRAEFVGLHVWNTALLNGSAQAQARLYAAVRQAREGAMVQGTETFMRGAQRQSLALSCKPIRDDGEHVTLILLELHDITALRQAEQAALKRAQQVEVMVETMTDGVVVLDANGGFEHVNAAGAHLFGLDQFASGSSTLPIAERASLVEIRDSEGNPLPFERLPTHRVLQGETLNGKSSVEFVAQAPDMPAREIEATGAPIHDGQGEIAGGVLVLRDITERRRAERDHEAQRKLLQAVIDELPGGVYLVEGADARLALSNRAAEALWDAPWRHGQPFIEFLHAHGITKYAENGQRLRDDELATIQAVRDGHAARQRVEILHYADGRTLPLFLNTTLLDQASLPAGLEAPCAVIIMHDVTALKEAEALKDEFIAVATHELRNPAAVLRGYSSMLTRRQSHSMPLWQRDAVQNMDVATQNLVNLTNDLLDATRSQAGQLALRFAPTDLAELTRNVAQRMHIAAAQIHITVETPTEPIIVQGDSGRLEQVITNLLSNAIKYSPEGAEARVTLVIAEDEALLSVTDHGMGIPEKQHARIFGRFARAENARRSGIPGTGLGLFLCREIIERHQGRIWFTSAEGAGSTFFVALPRLADGAADGR